MIQVVIVLDASIVDQNIQPLVLGGYFLESALNLVVVRNIAGERVKTRIGLLGARQFLRVPAANDNGILQMQKSGGD